MLFGRPLRSPAERYRRMARVRGAQIQRVAKEILRPERLVATAVGRFTPALVRKTESLFRAFR